VRRQQRITCHVWAQLAIAQDNVGPDREHGATRGALEPPDGEATQPDPDIVRVTCQIPAPTTGGFVFQLKAEGQEECQHQCDKRLAVAKQLKVGRFILEINSDGPVFARQFGRCAQVFPPGPQVLSADNTRWG